MRVSEVRLEDRSVRVRPSRPITGASNPLQPNPSLGLGADTVSFGISRRGFGIGLLALALGAVALPEGPFPVGTVHAQPAKKEEKTKYYNVNKEWLTVAKALEKKYEVDLSGKGYKVGMLSQTVQPKGTGAPTFHSHGLLEKTFYTGPEGLLPKADLKVYSMVDQNDKIPWFASTGEKGKPQIIKDDKVYELKDTEDGLKELVKGQSLYQLSLTTQRLEAIAKEPKDSLLTLHMAYGSSMYGRCESIQKFLERHQDSFPTMRKKLYGADLAGEAESPDVQVKKMGKIRAFMVNEGLTFDKGELKDAQEAYQKAVGKVLANGTVIVRAYGNYSDKLVADYKAQGFEPADFMDSMSRVDGIVRVVHTDVNGDIMDARKHTLAIDSTTGDGKFNPTIAAPGVNTVAPVDDGEGKTVYRRFGQSSQATVMLAAGPITWARILSEKKGGKRLTPAEMVTLIGKHGVDLKEPATRQGAGALDIVPFLEASAAKR